jgi:hypothetical protein
MPNAKLCQLGVLIIVAGCTTQPNKTANGGPDLQCHSEETVGSLITRSVCTTRAQRAAQQAALDDVRQSVQSGAGFSGRPTGSTAQ